MKAKSSVEFERQGAGVQRLARKKKFLFQGRSPIRFDELQVTIFIRPVDFVADNRVIQDRQDGRESGGFGRFSVRLSRGRTVAVGSRSGELP